MTKITLLTTVMALAMSTPALLADISLGFPRMASAGVQGNCDMMASNTVLASFVGLRNLTVQRVDQTEPATVQVAVFEVADNLAYRRFNRFADGRLEPGMQFTIAMNKELPGQPAEYVDTIAAMQPGDQVVMRVDHLYLMNGQSGESIRTCARLARRNAPAAAPSAAPAAIPAAAPAPLPIPGAAQQTNGMHMQMSSRSFSMTTDANGQMQTVQTSQEYDPATGQMKTRMIINGVEVDPVTRQPLAQAAAPAPAPVSESQAQQEAATDEEDDTIVEHNNNPVVQPGDKAPLPADIAPTDAPVPPAPVPDQPSNEGSISASESF